MNTHSALRPAPALLLLVPLAAGLLWSCAQKTPGLPTPVPTLTAQTTPPSPVPISQQQDVMILSIEENGFAHLFAYAPGKLERTRLTSGDWNDITPSVSPDGGRVAFASNRGGFWDLYLLDMHRGDITQLTNTPGYDSAPSWSPDLAWITYETYENGSLDIAILSLTDPEQKPIDLTNDPASDYSPAWSPNGRQIAFISNRSGDPDIWLADLDKTDNRFSNASRSSQAAENHPAWNNDGKRLAWASASQTISNSGIYVWDSTQPSHPPKWIGEGDWPAWNSRGDQITTAVTAPNQQFLSSFTLRGEPLLLPTSMPGLVRGLVWSSLSLPDPLPQSIQQSADQTPEALWSPAVTPVGNIPSQRWYVVPLLNVQAPNAQLHDLVDESFYALRQRVVHATGWDALTSLENTFVPLTTALDPGLGEDWLYTGRALALNSLMVNAGWMAVVREDIGSQTYWRLYLRAQNQDGSLGEPIHNAPWNLSARFDLNPRTYEAGGSYAPIPGGFWVDFTALASAYGWNRLPALSTWRNYYAGARFTEFALTSGLDWYSAMLELYPAEALFTATPVPPPTKTPTNTPIPSSTPYPTRTPRATGTPTLSPTPSLSPTPRPPTKTPLPSATPPTIIPTFLL